MKPRKPPPRPIRDMFSEATSVSPKLLLGLDLRDRKRPRGRGSNWTVNRQRLAEIARLIEHRHGGACDTADGSLYLTAALPALIEEAGGIAASDLLARVTTWAWDAVPPMNSAEIMECVAEARERNANRTLHLSAREIGDLLRLTIAEREAVDIRTMWPAGMTKAEFEHYRRTRDAARKKVERAAAGARSRDHSAEREKPWIALDMSRRNYYRRLAAGTLPTCGTNSSGLDTKYLQPRTEQCHGGQPPVPDPARKASASHSVGAGGHAAGGRTKAVRRGRAVAMPLPDGVSWVRGDILAERGRVGSVAATIKARLADYEGGPMTQDQRQAARDWLAYTGWTRREFGDLIGISRQQVTNSLRPRGSDGFGREAAANMRRLLALAA